MPKSSDAKPVKAPRAKSAPAAGKSAQGAAVKPAGHKAALAKPAPAAAIPVAKASDRASDKARVPAEGVKLRDLIDSVAAATGAKKSDAKISVEATLAALAAGLKAGADMTLPPLGKLRVVKLAKKGGAIMMTLKLRHGGGQKPGAKPLADDGEDD